ncbi:MAG: XdhC/CoxI family protein [Candidatus Puniceispirillum sp.]
MADEMIRTDVTNDALLIKAAEWHAAGHGVALALVMQTWGSSPRPAGSVMIIRDDQLIEGSVSGGCVEGAVIEAAGEAIASGQGQRLDFGVADATAWEVGLSCGGRIAVLVVPIAAGGIDAGRLGDLAANLRAREPVMLCLDAATGAWLDAGKEAGPGFSGIDPETGHFYLIQKPPRRVIVIGGVHITQFLAPMARLAGYDVMVIDPRAAFTAPERFPDIATHTGWPDEVMQDTRPDANTAIVTLTHDPKIDDPGLEAALSSEAFYIACLGSRRTHAARLERLAAKGFDQAQLARLQGPAGLDIGAKTPAEIAVSILAQMIAAERKPETLVTGA